MTLELDRDVEINNFSQEGLKNLNPLLNRFDEEPPKADPPLTTITSQSHARCVEDKKNSAEEIQTSWENADDTNMPSVIPTGNKKTVEDPDTKEKNEIVEQKKTETKEDSASYEVNGQIFNLNCCSSQNIGKSQSNEDGFAHQSLTGGGMAFMVLDGHGGDQVKNHVEQRLLKLIDEEFKNLKEPIDEEKILNAINAAFFKCNKEWFSGLKNKDAKTVASGCTACVAIARGDKTYIANAGDCRAIQVKKEQTEQKTNDMDYEDPTQRKILEKKVLDYNQKAPWSKKLPAFFMSRFRDTLHGKGDKKRTVGFSLGSEKDTSLPKRDQYGTAVSGRVETTAGFGDVHVPGLDEKPQITIIDMEKMQAGEQIVLATDGIWHVLNNDQVGNYTRDHGDETNIATKFLTKLRNTRQQKNDSLFDPDDATVLVFTKK